jgi:hypothetical protein
MIGSAAFSLTEMEWFKVQLRIDTLERSGAAFVTRYYFPGGKDEPVLRDFPHAEVNCWFWCTTTDELIKKKAPRSEHLSYYTTWVESEQQRLLRMLAGFPGLSKEFDLQRHIVFTVLHGYGMGSAVVCHFYDGKVQWHMSTREVPE